MGWASTRNGELLTLAEGQFDALAVVVLQAKADKVTHLSGVTAQNSANSRTFQRNGKDFPPAGARRCGQEGRYDQTATVQVRDVRSGS
jgi:hypothetical protein